MLRKKKMKIKYENNKPDKNKENWLCPRCNSRPAAQMVSEKDGESYCIYCGEKLNFED